MTALSFCTAQIKTVITMATERSHILIMEKLWPGHNAFSFDQDFSNMQASRTAIKSCTSLNFDKVGLLASELIALEQQKIYHIQ